MRSGGDDDEGDGRERVHQIGLIGRFGLRIRPVGRSLQIDLHDEISAQAGFGFRGIASFPSLLALDLVDLRLMPGANSYSLMVYL